MKRALLAVALLVVTLTAAYGYAATRRERTHRNLIDRGEDALARDETFAAIEAFSGAIALKGESMVGYLKRGEAYRRRGELEAALKDLRRAAEIDPGAPRPFELLGDVNYSLLRYGRAADSYAAYVRLDDRSPRVLYKLALARYRGAQPWLAIPVLRQAIAIDDHFAEAQYLLGLCLRDVQKRTEARAALERSVALAPAMLHAREELAELYGRLGRRDDRLAQLEALLALDPGPSREVTLGIAYAETGRTERAVITLGHAAERYPDHAYTYVALGRLWLEIAQARHDRVHLSKALEALENAAGADDSSEALTLFGRALLMASDEELAESMLQQAVERTPTDPLAFYYLAEASERRGHPDAARRALLDYEALQGADTDPRRRAAIAARIADLSMRVSDGAFAARWYQRAIEGGPADAGLLVRLAEAQLQASDVASARLTLAKALDKDPDHAQAKVLRKRLENLQIR